MISKIKIDGVYDQQTLTLLEEKKVNHFSFDLRPKSFNFIQEYKLLEMLKNAYRPWNKYFFHFFREKELVIRKFIDDIKVYQEVDNIFLEFSDEQGIDFYNSFNLPFVFHYNGTQSLPSLEKYNNLKGIVLPYNYLEHLNNSGTFDRLISKFLIEIKNLSSRQNFELILSMDWDDSIFPSLFDYLNFQIIAFPINEKIEISYRNVSHETLLACLVEVRRLS